MSNAYIGFRVELASRIVKSDLSKIIKQYNINNNTQLFDPYDNGKITVERIKTMLIARGDKDKFIKNNGSMVNFSVMTPIPRKELERVVQIVNVLGNNKLIRERVKIFVDRKSTLNQIPEFTSIIDAFNKIESYIPGFILSGWYYAPEAKF